MTEIRPHYNDLLQLEDLFNLKDTTALYPEISKAPCAVKDKMVLGC